MILRSKRFFTLLLTVFTLFYRNIVIIRLKYSKEKLSLIASIFFTPYDKQFQFNPQS
jgi:hypothetical protein